jgi:hypothetical protein
MRKRTIRIELDGQPIKANLYLYAFKDSWALYLGRERQQREFRQENAKRLGREAFNSPRSGYVVEQGGDDNDYHGCPVFTNCTAGFYYDVNPFPGKLIGYLHQEGRKLIVRRESPWTVQRIEDEPGKYVTQEARQVVDEDGKAHFECRPHAATTGHADVLTMAGTP